MLGKKKKKKSSKKGAPAPSSKASKPKYARLKMSDNVLEGQISCQKKKIADNRFTEQEKALMAGYLAHLEYEKSQRS